MSTNQTDDTALTLRLLKPEDLYPVWSTVDLMERLCVMSVEEATRWKQGVLGLMMLWGLEPDDLLCPCDNDGRNTVLFLPSSLFSRLRRSGQSIRSPAR